MVFICRVTFDSDFLEEEFHTAFGGLVEQGSTWCVILLSLVVVSSIVICAGGLHSSTHWHTYTPATCTVWWCIYTYNYIIIIVYYMTYVHIILVPDTPQWEDLINIDTKSAFSVAGFCKLTFLLHDF